MNTDPNAEITLKLPLRVWQVVHALAFKAPSTGQENVFPLHAFHSALLDANNAPPAAPATAEAAPDKPRAASKKAQAPRPVAEKLG